MTDNAILQKELDEISNRPRKEEVKIDPRTYKIPGQFTLNGMVLGFFTPKHHLEAIKELDLVESDIVIASYPKTGTTLTQEIVYLSRHDGNTDKANEEYNYLRIPYLDNAFPDHTNGLKLFQETPHPRHLKTHLPYDYMPHQVDGERNVRAIYVMRNPKDSLVSYYYFYKSTLSFGRFQGTWSDFFEMVLLDNICYGNILDHYLGWWKQRDNPNLLIVKYEDLLRNPRDGVVKLATFCGKPDLSEEVIDRIVEATSFKSMKSNPKTNWTSIPEDIDCSISPFMRKGLIGDWKNHFTVSQNEIFDRMIQQKLAGTGLEFTYEA